MAEIYNAGTVAVVQGSKTLVLTGGVWSPFNVRKGDIINLPNGYTSLVESVTDTTHLEMALPFDGATASGLAYAVVHGSVEWGTNVEIHHAVVRLLDSVENPLDILFGATVPDNADGENKQLYIRDNLGGAGHGDIYKKVDDVWQLSGNIAGPKGDAATITIGDVTTGAPGSAVAVTNSGDPNAAVFDFAIPQGLPGNSTPDDGSVTLSKLASDVDAKLLNHPPLRLSPNQYGHLDGSNNLQGWSKNGAFSVTISLVRTIVGGTTFANRPQEDQDVLSAMGISSTWFLPEIRVMKVEWSGWSSGMSTWLMFPGSTLVGGVQYTVGCYARLLSGTTFGNFFQGITNSWGPCGFSEKVASGYYKNAHPYVSSPTGAVEFVWPAVALGEVSLDPAAPQWGYFPSPYAADANDLSV